MVIFDSFFVVKRYVVDSESFEYFLCRYVCKICIYSLFFYFLFVSFIVFFSWCVDLVMVVFLLFFSGILIVFMIFFFFRIIGRLK